MSILVVLQPTGAEAWLLNLTAVLFGAVWPVDDKLVLLLAVILPRLTVRWKLRAVLPTVCDETDGNHGCSGPSRPCLGPVFRAL